MGMSGADDDLKREIPRRYLYSDDMLCSRKKECAVLCVEGMVVTALITVKHLLTDTNGQ